MLLSLDPLSPTGSWTIRASLEPGVRVSSLLRSQLVPGTPAADGSLSHRPVCVRLEPAGGSMAGGEHGRVSVNECV